MASYLHDVARQLIAFDTVSAKSNAAAARYLADELERHGFRVACQEYESGGVAKVNVVAVGRAAGRRRADRLRAHRRRAVRRAGGMDARAAGARDRRRAGLGPRHVRHEGLPRAVSRGGGGARSRRGSGVRSPSSSPPTRRSAAAARSGSCRSCRPSSATCRSPRSRGSASRPSWRVFHTHKGIVVVHRHGARHRRAQQSPRARAERDRGHGTRDRLHRGLSSRAARGAGRRPTRRIFPSVRTCRSTSASCSGGTADNMIADRCTLSVSYRPLPDADPRAVHAEIVRRLAAADLRDPGAPAVPARVDVGEPEVVAGMRSPRGSALEARAASRRSVATTSGGAPFATDGGALERGGIASLICGPGELEQAHQPNESMPRARVRGRCRRRSERSSRDSVAPEKGF